MKTQIIVLTLLVTILGVISEEFASSENEVNIEEQDLLVDDNTLHRQFQSDMDFDRKHHSKGDMNYGLVVTGGDNPKRTAVSEQISSMGVCVIPNLPKTIAGGKSVWIEASKILMFCGGSDRFKGHEIQYDKGWGAMDRCFKLKPREIKWKSISQNKMKVKRSWFSLNNINKKEAVAAGGMTTGYGNILDSIEKFSHGEWKPLLNHKGKEIKLDKATYGHCAVQFNIGRHSFLMIIGGSNNALEFYDATNAVTVYNLRTGHRIPLKPGELPKVWAPACTIKGEDIYVSGGGNNGSTYSAVYKGTKKGKFKKVGDLGAPRSGHTMGVTSKDQLIVAGGYNPDYEPNYLKQIESSDDDGKNWNTWSTDLTEGGEYAAMASVPPFTFKCHGVPNGNK